MNIRQRRAILLKAALAAGINRKDFKATKISIICHKLKEYYAMPEEVKGPMAVVEYVINMFKMDKEELAVILKKRKKKKKVKIPNQVTGLKISATDPKLKAFYNSWEWKRLRYDYIKERNRTCECCHATGVRIVVDHIKPIRKFWELRLDKNNLQLLCDDCNMGKGSRDKTNWSKLNALEAVETFNASYSETFNENDTANQWRRYEGRLY